jgi:hypothetical protein
MVIQMGFSSRTKRLKLRRNKGLSVGDRTIKKFHKGGYSRISIWNGLIGERILTYHLIDSNAAVVTRQYAEELDLGNAGTTSYFPRGTVIALR